MGSLLFLPVLRERMRAWTGGLDSIPRMNDGSTPFFNDL